MGELARPSEIARPLRRQTRRDPIEITRYLPEDAQLALVLAIRLAEEVVHAAMKIKVDQYEVSSVDFLTPAIREPGSPMCCC